jgi:hypothetical protein
MEFIVGIFFGALICFTVIAAVAHFLVRMRVARLEKALVDGIRKFREHVIPSRIEEVNGRLFLYNRETEEFLGQGTTFEELNIHVKERYPNKLFDVPEGELSKFIKGENA